MILYWSLGFRNGTSILLLFKFRNMGVILDISLSSLPITSHYQLLFILAEKSILKPSTSLHSPSHHCLSPGPELSPFCISCSAVNPSNPFSTQQPGRSCQCILGLITLLVIPLMSSHYTWSMQSLTWPKKSWMIWHSLAFPDVSSRREGPSSGLSTVSSQWLIP